MTKESTERLQLDICFLMIVCSQCCIILTKSLRCCERMKHKCTASYNVAAITAKSGTDNRPLSHNNQVRMRGTINWFSGNTAAMALLVASRSWHGGGWEPMGNGQPRPQHCPAPSIKRPSTSQAPRGFLLRGPESRRPWGCVQRICALFHFCSA